MACLIGSPLLADEFPSPWLREAMARQLKDCRDARHFVLRRKKPFYPEITLVRSVEVLGEASLEPYLLEYNKRDRFAFGIGTRPHVSNGQRGTLLYFVIGSENPKGFSTGGAGLFAPKRGAKATIERKNLANGTLAIITFNDVQYELRLKVHRSLPKDI